MTQSVSGHTAHDAAQLSVSWHPSSVAAMLVLLATKLDLNFTELGVLPGTLRDSGR